MALTSRPLTGQALHHRHDPGHLKPKENDVTHRMKQPSLIAFAALAFTLAAVAQQPQNLPQSANPGSPQPTQTTPAPAMSKSELKAQRKQQKHEENAAKANAKAQKDQANALTQQNKARDEQEKAQPK